jgi:hypothetical protein
LAGRSAFCFVGAASLPALRIAKRRCRYSPPSEGANALRAFAGVVFLFAFVVPTFQKAKHFPSRGGDAFCLLCKQKAGWFSEWETNPIVRSRLFGTGWFCECEMKANPKSRFLEMDWFCEAAIVSMLRVLKIKAPFCL